MKRMLKGRYILFLCTVSMLLTGCDALKSFMSRDLEEEDFIMFLTSMAVPTARASIARPL